MKNLSSVSKQLPFPFVLEELASIRPTIKRMFGFMHVYLGDKLLLSLRDSAKQKGTNGLWLYTTTEHIESLAQEFPYLPKRQLWRSKKNAWIILASRLEDFEEYLNGDKRIGRISRGTGQNSKPASRLGTGPRGWNEVAN